jgi:hypothetical protein
MRKTMAVTLAFTTGVLIAAGSAVGASSAPKKFTVHLKGSLEVPKGSPTGTGVLHYQLVTKTGLFCYDLKWSKIGSPVAAHVHKGAKGTAGPVVIPLSLGPPVAHSGCVKVKKSLLSAIKKKPSAYYVNVHTKKYPGGAIRGQL